RRQAGLVPLPVAALRRGGRELHPDLGRDSREVHLRDRRRRPRAHRHRDDAEQRRRRVRLLPADRCDRRVGHDVAVTPRADVAAAPVPPPVQESRVVQPGLAGAVAVADGRATVTFQPGAVPVQETVTLTAADAKFALPTTGLLFGVTNTTALPWPVDVAYAA